jgi:type IV pilus assembly protein PilB
VGGRLKLGQILVNRGILHPDQLAAALADQQGTGARLGMTLVRMGFVDEETLIRTLAGQLKLPVARIRGKRVSAEILSCIAVNLAEQHRCLPLFFKKEDGERVLFVAMEDPSDAEALDELARESGERLRPVLVGPTELEEALQRHYHWASLTGEAPEWSAPRPAEEAEASSHGADDPEPAFGPASEPEPEPAADAGGPGEDRSEEPAWPEDLGDADTAPELPDAGDAGDLDLDDEAAFEPDFELGPPEPPMAHAAPEPRPESTSAPGLRPDSLDPRIILRALSQLLVEKGVITRDEFVQRLGELAAREG